MELHSYDFEEGTVITIDLNSHNLNISGYNGSHNGRLFIDKEATISIMNGRIQSQYSFADPDPDNDEICEVPPDQSAICNRGRLILDNVNVADVSTYQNVPAVICEWGQVELKNGTTLECMSDNPSCPTAVVSYRPYDIDDVRCEYGGYDDSGFIQIWMDETSSIDGIITLERQWHTDMQEMTDNAIVVCEGSITKLNRLTDDTDLNTIINIYEDQDRGTFIGQSIEAHLSDSLL